MGLLTVLTKKIPENIARAYVVRPPAAAKKKKNIPGPSQKGGRALGNAEPPATTFIRSSQLRAVLGNELGNTPSYTPQLRAIEQ